MSENKKNRQELFEDDMTEVAGGANRNNNQENTLNGTNNKQQNNQNTNAKIITNNFIDNNTGRVTTGKNVNIDNAGSGNTINIG